MKGTERIGRSRRTRRGSSSRRLFLRALGVAGAGLVVGTSGVAGQDSPTEIESCTTITEPGEYVLAEDVSPATVDGYGCIDVRADDVVLDGRGYTIDGSGAVDDGGRVRAAGIAVNPEGTFEPDARPVENVTVRNVTVTGFATGLRYESVDGGRIAGVETPDDGVGIGLLFGARGIAIEDSRLSNSGTGVDLFGDPDVYGGPSDVTIARNDVEGNDVGIRLGHEATDNAIEHNRIVGNGTGTVQGVFARDNAVRRNAICDNAYGIRNVDEFARDVLGDDAGDLRFEDVLEATENYWGASDGPSSGGDPAEPFADPVTGALADGTGDTVSESLEPGVANVRFDPFLETYPEGAGVDDA